MTVDLLYFHGSTLEAFVATGKVRFLETLNPAGMFGSVHMVNVAPEATEDAALSRDGFRFTALGLARRGRGLVAKMRTLWEGLERLAREGRPRLVLADDANLLGLCAWWLARRAACRYGICVYYDNDLHHRLTGRPALGLLRSRRLERILEERVFARAAGVYAATRGYRDYALRHGADPDRTHLGSWSVDDIFYAAPPPPHTDGPERLFVGRLHPLKYVHDLIEAMTRLPHLRLDVAGEGVERARLAAAIQARGLADRVRLLGMIPREEVLARMQGARVLIVTQGFSAAVECLLSGRPVVAYAHECNAEVVRDDDTGVLVPFRDVEALARAVQRLASDPGYAARLGAMARRTMLEECAISRSVLLRRRFFEACLRG